MADEQASPMRAFARPHQTHKTRQSQQGNLAATHVQTTSPVPQNAEAPIVKLPASPAPRDVRGRKKGQIQPVTPRRSPGRQNISQAQGFLQSRNVTDPHVSAVPSPLKISGKFTSPVEAKRGPAPTTQVPTTLAEETPAHRVSDVIRSNTPVVQEPRQIHSTPVPPPYPNLPQSIPIPKGASSEKSQMSRDSHDNHPKAIVMSHSGLAPTQDGTYGRSGNVTVVNGRERIDSMVAVLEHSTLSPNVYSPQSSHNNFVPKTFGKPSRRYAYENPEVPQPTKSVIENEDLDESFRVEHNEKHESLERQVPSISEATSQERHRQTSHDSNNYCPVGKTVSDIHHSQPSIPAYHHEIDGRGKPRNGFNPSMASIPLYFRGNPNEMTPLECRNSMRSDGSNLYFVSDPMDSLQAGHHNSMQPVGDTSRYSQQVFMPSNNFVPPPPVWADPPATPASDLYNLIMGVHHHFATEFSAVSRANDAKHDHAVDQIFRRSEEMQEAFKRSTKETNGRILELNENFARVEGVVMAGIANNDTQIRAIHDEVHQLMRDTSDEGLKKRLSKLEQGMTEVIGMLNTFNMRFTQLEGTVENSTKKAIKGVQSPRGGRSWTSNRGQAQQGQTPHATSRPVQNKASQGDFSARYEKPLPQPEEQNKLHDYQTPTKPNNQQAGYHVMYDYQQHYPPRQPDFRPNQPYQEVYYHRAHDNLQNSVPIKQQNHTPLSPNPVRQEEVQSVSPATGSGLRWSDESMQEPQRSRSPIKPLESQRSSLKSNEQSNHHSNGSYQSSRPTTSGTTAALDVLVPPDLSEHPAFRQFIVNTSGHRDSEDRRMFSPPSLAGNEWYRQAASHQEAYQTFAQPQSQASDGRLSKESKGSRSSKEERESRDAKEKKKKEMEKDTDKKKKK